VFFSVYLARLLFTSNGLSPMLPDSRLYSFLSSDSEHALHFLEGQRLIYDLALISSVKGTSFSFLRDTILSLQPLIALLKTGEGLGLYLDIDSPYLRFKLETNFDGYMRTMLMPDELTEFPAQLTGVARVSKLMPGSSQPYNSAIELSHTPAREVTNVILSETYQTPGHIEVSKTSDQSALFIQLPRPNVNREEVVERAKLIDVIARKALVELVQSIFAKSSTSQEEIQQAFEQKGYLFLGSRQVKFKCSCSFERMIIGISSLVRTQGIDNIFGLGIDSIETKCDYCNTQYRIKRADCTPLQ
jgi:molecular chaperone Hsp33